MHEPKASALRNLDHYCIIRVRQIKTRGLAKCVIIVDHVTFSQSGAGLVLLSYQTFQHSREPLLCKWLEKALYVVLLLV